MKSNKIEREVKKKEEYPKLMKSTVTGLVLLMTKEGEGLVVFTEKTSRKIGEYDDGWDMRNFEDFNGTIELSN